jgi:hypothetical protein
MDCCLVERRGVIVGIIRAIIAQVFLSLALRGAGEGQVKQNFLFPVYATENLNFRQKGHIKLASELTGHEAGIWR